MNINELPIAEEVSSGLRIVLNDTTETFRLRTVVLFERGDGVVAAYAAVRVG